MRLLSLQGVLLLDAIFSKDAFISCCFSQLFFIIWEKLQILMLSNCRWPIAKGQDQVAIWWKLRNFSSFRSDCHLSSSNCLLHILFQKRRKLLMKVKSNRRWPAFEAFSIVAQLISAKKFQTAPFSMSQESFRHYLRCQY